MWKSLLWAACIGGFLRACVCETSKVYDDSMSPLVVPGDTVLVEKWAYGLRIPGSGAMAWKWSDPKINDLVVIAGAGDPPGDFLRQVKGLPGQEVTTPVNTKVTLNDDMYLILPIKQDPEHFRDQSQYLITRKHIIGRVNRFFYPTKNLQTEVGTQGKQRTFLGKLW